MNQFADLYSQYYDLLYQDKDYAAEVDYVDDLINVIFKVLDNENTIGEVYNIGTGKPVMIRSLIKLIKRITKKGTPLYGKLKFRKDEIKKLYPDISEIKKKLKWTPKISLKYGLKKTIKHYKNVI